MKKLLLSSAAFVAFGATSFAADLPAPMAVVEPLPVAAPYSWTGFYLGAQVGYAFRNGGDGDGCVDGTAELYDGGAGDIEEDGTTDVDCEDFDVFDAKADLEPLTSVAGADFPGEGFLESDEDDGDGGIFGGLHIGADWQMGSFVIGALADYNWSDIDGSSGEGTYDEDLYEYPGPLPAGSIGTVDGVYVIEDNGVNDASEEDTVDPRTDVSWESGGVDSWGTARVRAGFAAGRALFYATGGLAFGDIGDSSYDVTEYYTGREVDNSPLDAGLPANCEEADVVGARDPGAVCTYSDSDGGGFDLGWALGAGVSVLATNNFSVGLEYLFVNLEDSDEMDFVSLSGDTAQFGGNDNDFHTVSLKVSYRFGGGN